VTVKTAPATFVTSISSALTPLEVQTRMRKFGAGGVSPETMSEVATSLMAPLRTHWRPFLYVSAIRAPR
jgi:hypothetical protein